jgi:hypothetical protein
MKNPYNKTRDVNQPYEVWRNERAQWEWRVLKKWQIDDNKKYARWFCAVKSPMTHGSYDMGDVYVAEIFRHAVKVENPVIEKW